MSEFFVGKFGGTSMAQPEVALQVMENHPEQHLTVVSAIGATEVHPTKVTDLLLDYGKKKFAGKELEASQIVDEVVARHEETYSMLGEQVLKAAKKRLLSYLDSPVADPGDYAYVGEIMSAYLFSNLLSGANRVANYIDPKHIVMDSHEQVNHRATFKEMQKSYGYGEFNGLTIVPGFFGYEQPSGRVKTLGRGGSDRTGALYAAGLGWDYYNWTDVDGIYSAHPKIVENYKKLDVVTREEVRESANSGSGVLHGNVIIDLAESDVVVHLRNTFSPEVEGTKIVQERDSEIDEPFIISSKPVQKFFIKDPGMATRKGYFNKVTQAAEDAGISLEDITTTQDTITLTTEYNLDDKQSEKFLARLQHGVINPNGIVRQDERAKICIASEALRGNEAVAAAVYCKVFQLANDHGIKIDLPFGSSDTAGLGVIVRKEDMEPMVRAIHEAIVEKNNPFIGMHPARTAEDPVS
jgi:aspartate kinase